jgi:hypothetical protein
MATVEATHVGADGIATECRLTLSREEYDALASLLNGEAGDDGPLLDVLEALCPTWTDEVAE